MEQRMHFFGRALLMQLGLYLTLSLALGFLPEALSSSPISQVMFKILVFAMPIIYYSKLSGYRPFLSEEKRNISASGWFFRYVFGLCATVSVMNIVGSAVAYVKGNNLPTAFTSTADAVWSLILSVVMAAFFEEILFRGAFFHASDGQNGISRIILCAVFFALMHYSLSQFLYALAAGIVISAFFYENKSLLFSVLLHAGANFVTWFFALARSFGDTSAWETALAVIFALIAAAGLIILLIKRKKTPEGGAENFVYIGAEGTIYIIMAVILTAIA